MKSREPNMDYKHLHGISDLAYLSNLATSSLYTTVWPCWPIFPQDLQASAIPSLQNTQSPTFSCYPPTSFLLLYLHLIVNIFRKASLALYLCV